jgi:hypothetical protein
MRRAVGQGLGTLNETVKDNIVVLKYLFNRHVNIICR